MIQIPSRKGGIGMREFYFIVSPTEKYQERKIRVYGVEKGKGQQANYEQVAKQVEDYQRAQKKKLVEESVAYPAEGTNRSRNNNSLALEMEMMKRNQVSLEERQEQLAFQKKAQESRMKLHQMAMAYGKE